MCYLQSDSEGTRSEKFVLWASLFKIIDESQMN